MRPLLRLVGARIREFRESQSLSAPEVAALVGCDVSHYYAIERGAHPPSFDLLLSIAHTLKVDEADLFVWPEASLRHRVRELVRRLPHRKLAEAEARLIELDESTRKV